MLERLRVDKLIGLGCLMITVMSYIQISVEIDRELGQVSYNIPIEINSHEYKLAASLENKEQFISPLSETKKSKKQKKIHKNPDNMYGTMRVTSLAGYNLEGWRRYFMQAFLYISQRYYHQIIINLDQVQQRSSSNNRTNGVITFGPNINENHIFLEIKKNTQYINQNLIAIYSGRSGGKNARLQLGGYQETFAYGHKDGTLFQEIPLQNTTSNWILTIDKMYCSRQKSKQWDQYIVNFQGLKLNLNIQSQYLILPIELARQLQNNFITKETDCLVQNNQLTCKNMTNIDLALNMLSFRLGTAWMNVSLYDLRNQYIQKQNKTTFFVKFDNKRQNWQFGNSMIKSHYIALSLDRRTLLFSPINRFPDTFFSSVYVIRFIVFFILFTVLVSIGVGIWQKFTNSNFKTKFTTENEGIRLVTYQRPNDQDFRDYD